ncbi:hypothetical protein NDU88_002819 [Pleurodeles waltl]|uniref:Uncharacterized protein n=1 Tax=Pleurodeles waltl TaxID=8319 RepID=A0AAV7WMK7_PLEWA|nr:hypothetical protein NDU88_002819 [Pleurodeles waltl]
MPCWFLVGCAEVSVFPSKSCFRRVFVRSESASEKVADWSAPIKRRDYGVPSPKEVWTLGVCGRRSTHCRKQWEDLRPWAQKTAEAQLGMASQRERGARRTLTPLMAYIQAVAYPELDGRLRESQQPEGGEYSGYHYKF